MPADIPMETGHWEGGTQVPTQQPPRTWVPAIHTRTPWRHKNGDIVGEASVHTRPDWKKVSRHLQLRIAMRGMLHEHAPLAWQIITNGPPHARP